MKLTLEEPSGSRAYEVLVGLLVAFLGGFFLYKGLHGLMFGPESPADASAEPALDLVGILAGPWMLILGGRLIAGATSGKHLLGQRELLALGLIGILASVSAALFYHEPRMLTALPIGIGGLDLRRLRARATLLEQRPPRDPHDVAR